MFILGNKCMAVTNDDNLLICDTDIYKYNATGPCGHILIKAKLADDESPMSIAVCRSSGNVAVACCFLDPIIQVLDVQLNKLFRCQAGSDIGVFGSINLDVKFDEYGYILVSNSKNKSIYIFGSTERLYQKFHISKEN